MLGTTAFINAVLQCSSELAPVSVIRLCGPSTHILPPFINWPNDLRKRIEKRVYLAKGGYECDGKELSKVDAKELQGIAKELIDLSKKEGRNFENLVLCGIFSPTKYD